MKSISPFILHFYSIPFYACDPLASSITVLLLVICRQIFFNVVFLFIQADDVFELHPLHLLQFTCNPSFFLLTEIFRVYLKEEYISFFKVLLFKNILN